MLPVSPPRTVQSITLASLVVPLRKGGTSTMMMSKREREQHQTERPHLEAEGEGQAQQHKVGDHGPNHYLQPHQPEVQIMPQRNLLHHVQTPVCLSKSQKRII